MRPARLSSTRLGVLAAIGVLALAGCGRLNRSATINQVTVTSGATTAVALQQQLAANHGLPGAHVTCAKRMVVNVGTTTSCDLTGAGKYSVVRFTFSTSHGRIDTGSVKPS